MSATAYDTSRAYAAALTMGRIRRDTGRRIAARARRRAARAFFRAVGLWLAAAFTWCLTTLAARRVRVREFPA